MATVYKIGNVPGVAVLLRVYANCIDGTDHDNNQRIATALD
jgi:hypothetical protein